MREGTGAEGSEEEQRGSRREGVRGEGGEKGSGLGEVKAVGDHRGAMLDWSGNRRGSRKSKREAEGRG